jgi:hypothetical protein
MPKEVHYLLLSPDEMRECMCDYTNGPGAVGKDRYERVSEVELLQSTEGGINARVKLHKRDEKEPEVREFIASDIASALLAYCRKRNIPIAKRANKKVEMFNGQIALMMTVDFPKEDPSVSDSAVNYTGIEAQEVQSRTRSQ